MTVPDSGSSSGPGASFEADARELPLLPLVDAVCFPRTELRLRLADRASCRFLRGLFAEEGDGARFGLFTARIDPKEGVGAAGDAGAGGVADRSGRILSLPRARDWAGGKATVSRRLEASWNRASQNRASRNRASRKGRPAAVAVPIHAYGVVARLVRLEALAGACDVLLRGEARLRLAQPKLVEPGQVATVFPLEEPEISEQDPDVAGLRREIVGVVEGLVREHEDDFVEGYVLGAGTPFEEMVNRLASEPDWALGRKLQMLRDSLPDRALHLLTLLRGRRQLLDLLQPFRHLTDGVDTN